MGPRCIAAGSQHRFGVLLQLEGRAAAGIHGHGPPDPLCARKASLLHDTRCAWYLRKGRLGTYAYFSYLFYGFYAVVD